LHGLLRGREKISAKEENGLNIPIGKGKEGTSGGRKGKAAAKERKMSEGPKKKGRGKRKAIRDRALGEAKRRGKNC